MRSVSIQIAVRLSDGNEGVYTETIKINSKGLRSDIGRDKGYSISDSKDEDLCNQAKWLFEKIKNDHIMVINGKKYIAP